MIKSINQTSTSLSTQMANTALTHRAHSATETERVVRLNEDSKHEQGLHREGSLPYREKSLPWNTVDHYAKCHIALTQSFSTILDTLPMSMTQTQQLPVPSSIGLDAWMRQRNATRALTTTAIEKRALPLTSARVNTGIELVAKHLGEQTQIEDTLPIPRFDKNGLIKSFLDGTSAPAESISMPGEQVARIHTHQKAMDFLDTLGLFNNPDCLYAIGVLAADACKLIRGAPVAIQPFLLDTLELKKEVAMSLAINPAAYQSLEDIQILKAYFEEAPFDTSDTLQATLNTLRNQKITCPEGLDSTAETIRRNKAYRDGWQQLLVADNHYFYEISYGENKDNLYRKMTLAKDLPANTPGRAEMRAAVIREWQQHTRDYLNVLCQVVGEVDSQGGGCIAPGRSAKDVYKMAERHLAKLDNKIDAHLSGKRSLTGQEAVSFAKLWDFFEDCPLLPGSHIDCKDGATGVLANKCAAISARACQISERWALDAVAQKLILLNPPEEVLDEDTIAVQTASMQTLVPVTTKKLQATGELPLFTGDLEKAVTALSNVHLFFDASDVTSVDCKENLNTALQGLKEIGVLTLPAYDRIMQAPENIRPFMLQALELKMDIARALESHPEVIDTLVQLEQAHHVLVHEAPFTSLFAEEYAQINLLHPLNKDIIKILSAAQVNHAYQTGETALKQAEVIYRKAIFESPEKGMPSVWNQALDISHMPKEARKIPEQYESYQELRKSLMSAMTSAVESYLDASYQEMKNIEDAGGALYMRSSVFAEKVKAYLNALEKKKKSCFDGERHEIFNTKTTSFKSLLTFLADNPLLPEESPSIFDKPNVFAQIEQTRNEISQLAAKHAASWLLAAGIKALKTGCDFFNPNNNIKPDAKAQVETIRLMQQDIEVGLHQARRQQRIVDAQQGGIFPALANTIDAIEIVNAEYEYSRAMNRYYYPPRAMCDTQSRGYNNNPHFLADILSTAASGWNQAPQPPAPRATTQPSKERTPFDTELNNKQARDMLCKELNVSLYVKDTELQKKYRRELINCHPDKLVNAAHREESELRTKMLTALKAKWQN